MKRLKKASLVIAIIIIFSSLFQKTYAINNNYNIVFINSTNSNDTREDTILNGFKEEIYELTNKETYTSLHVENYDIHSCTDREYVKSFNESINNKYKDMKIDLVIGAGDAACEFIKTQLSNEDSVLYKKYTLLSGITLPLNLTKGESDHIRVIKRNFNMQSINELLKIHEDVDKVNIVANDYIYKDELNEQIEIAQDIIYRDIEMNIIIEDNISEVLKQIGSEKQILIINGLFEDDINNTSLDYEEIIRYIKTSSDAYIYTNSQRYIDGGAIGGYIEDKILLGKTTANEAVSMLLDKDITDDYSIVRVLDKGIFNYNEIKKLDIPLSKYPQTSNIINKPDHVLFMTEEIERDLKQIFLIMIMMFICLVLFTILIITIIRKHRLQVQMHEALKEKEKSQTDFMVNMSHELRTPLNVILSTIKVCEMKINTGNYNELYVKTKLNQINKNSNRLLKIVNNLIDITKFEVGNYNMHLENLNIVQVIEEITMATIDYAKCKNLGIIFDTEEEEIITAIDKDKIERVVLNLLSNAIKYNKTDGNIEVYIRRDKNNVYIKVKDSGIGIEQDKIDEIFNRFYQVGETLKKHNEGSGIGLCIVEEIVGMHKGEIKVSSVINEGSTFEIILPIYIVDNEVENKMITDVIQSVRLEMSDVDTK